MRVKGDAEGTAKVLNLLNKYSRKKKDFESNATDEEVKDFLKTFLIPTQNINHSITSYSLKHLAERTIGHLFYRSEWYTYVGNDQIKRCMRELGYKFQQDGKDSPNECFNFRLNAKLQIYIEISDNPQMYGLNLSKKTHK